MTQEPPKNVPAAIKARPTSITDNPSGNKAHPVPPVTGVHPPSWAKP